MIEFIKENWKILSAISSGGLGLGVLLRDNQAVKRRLEILETKSVVLVNECQSHKVSCKELNSNEFGHGSREFIEIKSMIGAIMKRQEEQSKSHDEKHEKLEKLAIERQDKLVGMIVDLARNK